MTAPTSAKPSQARPRRVHVLLRDGAVVDGGIYLMDGQALAPYLGSRKGGWANIVGAVWESEGEVHNHAVLQADHILMASSPDDDYPVHFRPTGAVPRSADISLEDGTRVQGTLHLADKQRLSDYLTACGKFMPVLAAKRVDDGNNLGDIALNCGCVKAVRDAKVFAPGAMQSADDAKAEWGGLRRSTGSVPIQQVPEMPLNRDVIRNKSGVMEVITPGRIPDRRVGQPPYVSPGAAPEKPKELNNAELTPQLRARISLAGRHWLVLIGAGSHFLPPDPRDLSDHPSLEEIWRALAKRNDVADGELAVQVAAAFKLPLANLEEITAEAIRSLPEKTVRKLGVIPLRIDGKSLVVALSDPHSIEIEQRLGFVTKLNLQFEVATPADIKAALDWHYRNVPGLNS